MDYVTIKSGDLSEYLKRVATRFTQLDKYGNKMTFTVDFDQMEVTVPCPQGVVVANNEDARREAVDPNDTRFEGVLFKGSKRKNVTTS